MVEIERIIHYGRWFSDLENQFDVSWWLCTDNFEVYHTEDLMADYCYESVPEIIESSRFIPFFQTDIIQLEKEFIRKLNNRSYDRTFEKILLSNDSYDVAFRIFIEREFMTDSWNEVEKARLRSDAVAWCRENHIMFRE